MRATRRTRASLVMMIVLLLTSRLPAQQPDAAPPSAQPGAAPAAGAQPLAPRDSTADDGLAGEWAQWTDGRYRITPGDVLELRFQLVPELDQVLRVQPDGYVTLREVGDMRVQGRTLPQVRAEILDAYAPILREPVVTVQLTEFEAPYFVAAGEVARPGRYDLRGATTLSQALAYAGGPASKGRASRVLLLRKVGGEVEVREVNVKKMYAKGDLSEDPLLRPGDTLYVPRSGAAVFGAVMERAWMIAVPWIW